MNWLSDLRYKRLLASVLIVAIVGMCALLVSTYAAPLQKKRKAEQLRQACEKNLTVLWGALQSHASTSSDGYYPELSRKPGTLMFESLSPPLQPSDHQLPFLCPDDVPDEIVKGKSLEPGTAASLSYTYLGYAISNESELEAFSEVYEERVRAGLPFNEDLNAPTGKGSFGGNKFLRFGPQVDAVIKERPELATQVPVMWDQFAIMPAPPGTQVLMCNHVPGGSNVLFLDGHVEFCKYPKQWPLTRGTAIAMTRMQNVAQQQSVEP